MGAVLEALAENLPSPKGIATMTTTITGVDGNDIGALHHPPDRRDRGRCRVWCTFTAVGWRSTA